MSTSKLRIHTLTTCFNRKEKTLSILSQLNAQALSIDSVIFKHFVLDDNSSDGTSDNIAAEFPNVRVFKNKSSALYWAGGMLTAWNLIDNPLECDYLLVYNDDIILDNNALERMISSAFTFADFNPFTPFILGASFRDPSDGSLSYGGLKRFSWWHSLRFRHVQPTSDSTPVAVLNFNLCLINQLALSQIGFLSDKYVHSLADFDYCLRLHKSLGRVLLAPGFYGSCQRNINDDNFIRSSRSLSVAFQRLLHPKIMPIRPRLYFYQQHAGFFWPLLFLLPYFTLPFKYFCRLRQPNL